jgi:hypothetical protein
MKKLICLALFLGGCTFVPAGQGGMYYQAPPVVYEPVAPVVIVPYYYSPYYCYGCWYGYWGGRWGYHRGGGHHR